MENGRDTFSPCLLLQYHKLAEQLARADDAGIRHNLTTQLSLLSPRLTPKLLAQYDRVRQHYDHDGKNPVVEVKTGFCRCGCKVPTSQYALLYTQIQACQNCGRLLVRVFADNSS